MMKEKVKELWKLCFDDSEAFVEMYFHLRYDEEVNVAIQSGKKVISALQMLPYPMTFCGRIVQTSYISGACTHPDFRGKGIMRDLLSQSFRRMYDNGILFSTLIPANPWLFDYYTGMGYTRAFRYSIQEITIPEISFSEEINVDIVSDYQEEVYLYLNKRLAGRPCCIQQTPETFKAIMADLTISDGFLLAAYEKNVLKGIVIVYQTDEQLIINELFADNDNVKHSLLRSLKNCTNNKSIIQLLPIIDVLPTHTLGMARIINAKEVLRLYVSAFPDSEMQIQLFDEQLSENNGYYKLQNGKCTFSTEKLPGVNTSININELTNNILRPLQPYMSLMLN